MITVDKLPKEIQEVADQHKIKREKYDVFPSKFYIDDDYYYCFLYKSNNEQLIIRDDGKVLPYKEIEKVAMTATAYNGAIMTVSGNGIHWVNVSTKKIYTDFVDRLIQVKNSVYNLSPETIRAIDNIVQAARTIVEEQEKIEEYAGEAIRLIRRTNETEVTTERDYYQLRKYVQKIGWCGLRQNEVQLDTELDREKVLKELQSKAFINPVIFRHIRKIRKVARRMLTHQSKEGQQFEVIRKHAKELATEKYEDTEEAKQLHRHFRNP